MRIFRALVVAGAVSLGIVTVATGLTRHWARRLQRGAVPPTPRPAPRASVRDLSKPAALGPRLRRRRAVPISARPPRSLTLRAPHLAS